MSKNNQKKKLDMASKIEQPKRQSAQRAFIQQLEEVNDSNDTKEIEVKVAKRKPIKQAKENIKPTDGILSNNEVEEGDDNFWEDLRSGRSSQKRNKVLTTFYLEADLDEVIKVLQEREGKGFKSKFINESIRHSLISQGIIQ